MAIRYVLGRFHDHPPERHGHLMSALPPGYSVQHGFELRRIR